MLFEFIGMFAVCAVGIFFVAGGMLGNSMPTVIGGTVAFFIGVVLIVHKFVNDILAPPVETYSMTLSIDNTTIFTGVLSIIVLVISPYAFRAWLNRGR